MESRVAERPTQGAGRSAGSSAASEGICSGTARVFLFPGQSSVGAEALIRARQAHPASDAIAQRTVKVFGEARAANWLNPAGARLQSNHDTQIVVFLSTQMYLAALAAEGIEAACSLGLSLGEYSHLVHIGALDFEDALRLVDERGRCYDQAPEGWMVTALAVDHQTVAGVVEQARAYGPIVISNYNAPTQHVMAGAAPAVEWAARTLEDEYAAHTIVIERRVPMHSPMMAGVADAFAPALVSAPWRAPARDYRPNVSGLPLTGAGPADFVSHLTRHVTHPVLWHTAVEAVVAAHPSAAFVEVGPGSVLHNMMGRSWRSLRRAHVDAPDGADPRSHFAAVVEALHA